MDNHIDFSVACCTSVQNFSIVPQGYEICCTELVDSSAVCWTEVVECNVVFLQNLLNLFTASQVDYVAPPLW